MGRRSKMIPAGRMENACRGETGRQGENVPSRSRLGSGAGGLHGKRGDAGDLQQAALIGFLNELLVYWRVPQ